MVYIIFQILVIIGAPIALVAMARRKWLPAWLSPVVLSYGIGIILSNVKLFPLDDKLSQHSSELTIALALPLLLFGTQLTGIGRTAGKALFAFVLCSVAGVIGTTVSAFVYQGRVADPWMISGMLAGIFTGGTPNMQAIGFALGASQDVLILVNAADVFTGGIFLFLLLSVIPGLLAKFLPPFQGDKGMTEEEATMSATIGWPAFKGLLVSVLIIGLSMGTTFVIFGGLSNSVFIILAITTLSVAASMIPEIRRWPGTFELGEFFLLMFCVSLGLMANFQTMVANGLDIVFFTATALVLTAVLHWLLCRIFNIDRDTTLISGTAAIFGPAFIGQVAAVIGNKRLVFTGIALGLLGFAIGNYLGIGLALVLQWWFNG